MEKITVRSVTCDTRTWDNGISYFSSASGLADYRMWFRWRDSKPCSNTFSKRTFRFWWIMLGAGELANDFFWGGGGRCCFWWFFLHLYFRVVLTRIFKHLHIWYCLWQKWNMDICISRSFLKSRVLLCQIWLQWRGGWSWLETLELQEIMELSIGSAIDFGNSFDDEYFRG